jgi:hypothetical protein
MPHAQLKATSTTHESIIIQNASQNKLDVVSTFQIKFIAFVIQSINLFVVDNHSFCNLSTMFGDNNFTLEVDHWNPVFKLHQFDGNKWGFICISNNCLQSYTHRIPIQTSMNQIHCKKSLNPRLTRAIYSLKLIILMQLALAQVAKFEN